MQIKKINTQKSLWDIYKGLDDRYISFFLDSSLIEPEMGRFSIMGFDPVATFRSKGRDIEHIENGEIKRITSDPLKYLDSLLEKNKQLDPWMSKNLESLDLPFINGLLGYIAYDMKDQIETIEAKTIDDLELYEQYWGIYNNVLIEDHIKNEKYYLYQDLVQGDIQYKLIEKAIEKESDLSLSLELGEISSNYSKAEYLEAIKIAKEHIRVGDIYQVNLSQRFQMDIKGCPKQFYEIWRKINPSSFGAFLHFPEYDILSISPERFIKIKDEIIETRPIKGTRPRGKNLIEDEKIARELLDSEKDRAELLMIVDLERNDLGRISKTGSIKVENLFKINKYATLYHLDAIVRGELYPETPYEQIIRACFPGGSITGAPKLKAMEIIEKLEPNRRGVYTGSIGYIDFRGNCDLNIAIRTAVIKDNILYYNAGGGIVADSVPEIEYEETLTKTKSLILTKEAIENAKMV